MIETFKYLNGHYDTGRPVFERTVAQNLRGHSMTLQKRRSRIVVRTNYFSNRINNVWNSLPESVIAAPSVNAFKGRLDRHWKDLPTIFNPSCHN